MDEDQAKGGGIITTPKSIFELKNLKCECGNDDFETYHSNKVERGLSDIYVFYSICKKCNTKWAFEAIIEYNGGRSIKEIKYSDPKKTDKKIPKDFIKI